MTTELKEVLHATALELFPKREWLNARKHFEKIGINTEYYDMRCTAFETTYEKHPELFSKMQWVNDENGMPLWVRPGVDWIPDHELDDNQFNIDIYD